MFDSRGQLIAEVILSRLNMCIIHELINPSLRIDTKIDGSGLEIRDVSRDHRHMFWRECLFSSEGAQCTKTIPEVSKVTEYSMELEYSKIPPYILGTLSSLYIEVF